MTVSRYSTDSILGLNRQFGTARAFARIRRGIRDGTLGFKFRTVKQGERLDTIAGNEYEDSTMWWVIAAASDIGWGLQQPPGIVIRVPDKNQIIGLVS